MTPGGASYQESADLPAQITRPLSLGLGAIGGCLLVFVIWAVWAPLATSIPVTGHLNAKRPSFDVQHAYGGKIAELHVKQHSDVVAGQTLITLDVRKERAERSALQKTLAPLLAEQIALKAALQTTGSKEINPQAAPDTTSLAVDRIGNMQKTMALRAQMSAQLQEALLLRSQSLERSVSHRETQRGSMQARFARYQSLLEQGAFRAADIDALQEDILELEAAIQRDHAEVASLRQQARQADLQIERDTLEFRQQLLDRLAQLEEAIPRIKLQILRLSAQIAEAVIRAPEDGVVASLSYDTEAMVIARGDTVLTLSRPTLLHQVSFSTPPEAIDQIRVGMKGQLFVTSLSQRNHPRVAVEVLSLSPEARRNAEGTIIGYDGIAKIDTNDHAELLSQMGGAATLSTDMPVSLIFKGRDTTFGGYLIGPFLDFLNKAMQD